MGEGWTGRSNVYYRKVIRKDNDAVSLDADMIRLLIAIDEKKNLYQIAEEVGMGSVAFEKTLSKLLDLQATRSRPDRAGAKRHSRAGPILYSNPANAFIPSNRANGRNPD
jgi:hypothetical protein